MADPDEMIQKTLEHIDKKRAALGLPVYDPEKFGKSAIRACSSWRSCPFRNAWQPCTAWRRIRRQTQYVKIHCNPRHSRRKRPGYRSGGHAPQGADRKGTRHPVSFPNTAYYLPLILGMTGQQVESLGQLQPVMNQARQLLHPVPNDNKWTPYLGETLDSGMATLLAAETIEAVRFVYGLQPEGMPGFELAGGTAFTSPDGNAGNGDGHLNGPIDDIQLRSWGIQLVDGRMPGFAAIVGAAKSNEVAVKIVRELQRRISCASSRAMSTGAASSTS